MIKNIQKIKLSGTYIKDNSERIYKGDNTFNYYNAMYDITMQMERDGIIADEERCLWFFRSSAAFAKGLINPEEIKNQSLKDGKIDWGLYDILLDRECDYYDVTQSDLLAEIKKQFTNLKLSFFDGKKWHDEKEVKNYNLDKRRITL